MSTDESADVPRSLAALALVLLPLSGCTAAVPQPDPVLEITVTAVAPQDGSSGVAVAQPSGETVLVTSLDAEDGSELTVTGRDAAVVYTVEESTEDIGAGAARYALKQVGIPYVWGGNTPKGFDCSGLIQYSYARAGVEFPRATVTQRKASRYVSRASLRPGDLVFFHIDGKRYSHLGMYVGDGRFVHAPRTGKVVSTASLDNPYWQRNYAGGRRPRALFDEVSAVEKVRTEY